MNNYEKQANDFLTKVGATIATTFKKNGKHFDSDKDNRDIYSVTIQRGSRKFTFDFGQSIAKSGFYFTVGKRVTPIDRKYLDKDYLKKYNLSVLTVVKRVDYSFTPSSKSDIIHYPESPTAYDILACLTKYDPNTFEDFCSEFGYNEDSKTAEKIYNAVVNEYKNVCALFTDSEIELLQDIQ